MKRGMVTQEDDEPGNSSGGTSGGILQEEILREVILREEIFQAVILRVGVVGGSGGGAYEPGIGSVWMVIRQRIFCRMVGKLMIFCGLL